MINMIINDINTKTVEGKINFINQNKTSIFAKLIIKARLGFVEVLPSLKEEYFLSDYCIR